MTSSRTKMPEKQQNERAARPTKERLEKLSHHVELAREQINGALDDLADESDWAAADKLLRDENYRLGDQNERLKERVRELESENEHLLTRLSAIWEVANKPLPTPPTRNEKGESKCK